MGLDARVCYGVFPFATTEDEVRADASVLLVRSRACTHDMRALLLLRLPDDADPLLVFRSPVAP